MRASLSLLLFFSFSLLVFNGFFADLAAFCPFRALELLGSSGGHLVRLGVAAIVVVDVFVVDFVRHCR